MQHRLILCCIVPQFVVQTLHALHFKDKHELESSDKDKKNKKSAKSHFPLIELSLCMVIFMYSIFSFLKRKIKVEITKKKEKIEHWTKNHHLINIIIVYNNFYYFFSYTLRKHDDTFNFNEMIFINIVILY